MVGWKRMLIGWKRGMWRWVEVVRLVWRSTVHLRRLLVWWLVVLVNHLAGELLAGWWEHLWRKLRGHVGLGGRRK